MCFVFRKYFLLGYNVQSRVLYTIFSLDLPLGTKLLYLAHSVSHTSKREQTISAQFDDERKREKERGDFRGIV